METERIIITELIVEIPDENDPLGYLQGYSLDTVFHSCICLGMRFNDKF